MTNIDMSEVMSLTHGFLTALQGVFIQKNWHHGPEVKRYAGLSAGALKDYGDVLVGFFSEDNNVDFEIKKMVLEQVQLSFLSRQDFLENLSSNKSSKEGVIHTTYDGKKAAAALSDELYVFLDVYTSMTNAISQPARKIKP